MLKLFTNNATDATQDRIKACPPNNAINQAITRSMIQADNALNNAQFSDAHKFYRYALQLSEMHFGEHDSVVNNLKSLLKALDELLSHRQKSPAVGLEKPSVN